jgi:hypothetical protein
MAPRQRWIALGISVPGILICIASFVRFFAIMQRNDLPWNHRPFFQEHYLAVGKAYSQAFIVGFFFCLFLMTAAAAFLAWYEQRRRLAGPGD